jgi:hypothetical protein
MSRRILPAVAVLAVCGLGLLPAGCGSRKDRPVLARVSGTVTYNGKPLPKATVVFYPEQQGIRSAMGATDEQGGFTLWTYDPGDGAPVGKHKVTVTLRGPPEKAELHPSVKGKGFGEAYYDQVAATGKPLIPEKYFTTQTSGLIADVQAGRQNTFDFALTGPPLRKR